MALGNGDEEQFVLVAQPVYINRNAYLNGAAPFHREAERFEGSADPRARLSVEGNAVYLELEVEDGLLGLPTQILRSEDLGMPRVVEAPFDAPDGSLITLDTDYLGHPRSEAPAAGPLEVLKPGFNRICVWQG